MILTAAIIASLAFVSFAGVFGIASADSTNNITMSANVYNSGNVTVENVPVQFYVDNNLVATSYYNFTAGQTTAVSYTWATSGLSSGTHTVVITLDSNNTFLRINNNTNSYSTNFYIGDGGWGVIDIVLGVSFIVLIIITFLVYRKKKGRKKKSTLMNK